MIRHVASLLRSVAVKSTWFVTHRSPAIEELRQDPGLFELGIHPNFLAGSSHGGTTEQVIKHCMDLVPEAVSMRTHALVQSGPLLQEVVRLSPIRIDASLFLPGVPAVPPIVQNVISRKLVRVPYTWEDDDEMARPQPCWDHHAFIAGPSPTIFDFHPIYVYLNSSSPDAYQALKSRRASLTEVREEDAERYVSHGAGAGSMFRALVGSLDPEASMRIRDLVEHPMARA